MKKMLSFLLFTLTLAATAQTVTVTGVFDYDEAKATVRAINKARMNKGLNTLKMEQGLTDAAMLRAAEYSTQRQPYEEWHKFNTEDDRPNGKKFTTLIEEHYTMPQGIHCGEWLFCLKNNPNWTSVYRDFKDEDQLVFEPWTSVGAAVFYRDDNTYAVLIFSKHTNANTVIPSGKWKIKTQVSTVSGKKTAFLTKEEISTYEFTQKIDISGTFYYDFATEVVRLVNHIRDSLRLPPLSMDSVLTECAMIRSAEMAAYRSYEIQRTNFREQKKEYPVYMKTHTRPNNQRPFTLLPGKYEESSQGENIAFAHTTPLEVVNDWMTSPGHRGNILKKGYKTIGVGVFIFDNVFRWCQLFSSVPETEGFHPDKREKAKVQISFDPAVESKVLDREKVE